MRFVRFRGTCTERPSFTVLETAICTSCERKPVWDLLLGQIDTGQRLCLDDNNANAK